jgi:hypothetical protein
MRPLISGRTSLPGFPKFEYMAAAAAPSAASQAQQAYQQNLQARAAVLGQAVDMWQPIFSQSISAPTPGTVLNIPVRQVGFTKRFLVKLTAVFSTNASTGTFVTTPIGLPNMLSQVVVNDLANYTRINTTGWHLWMLQSRKKAFWSGLASAGMASYQPNPGFYGQVYPTDFPGGLTTNVSNSNVNFENSWACMSGPSTVAAASTNNVATCFWELPLAYSDVDLRGAIYTSVVSATMNLQLTLNPNFFAPSGTADSTLSVYKGTAAGGIGTLTTLFVTVYQNYLDQLPFSSQGPILPASDLSKMYLLTNTSFTGLASGQDFPIVFPNFRAWQSLAIILDNAGTLSSGTDVNRIQLQTANLTNIWQFQDAGAPSASAPVIPLNTNALLNRLAMNTDWPAGMYWFDFRSRPVNTNNFGNMQLTVSPTNSTSTVLAGFEGIGIANQVISAGSIPGN